MVARAEGGTIHKALDLTATRRRHWAVIAALKHVINSSDPC